MNNASENMQSIISHFALTNEVLEPKPVKVGIINQSYILPTAVAGGKSYFLQKINHHIFTDVEGLQRNIDVVTRHIREKLQAEGARNIENRVLQLVPTLDGELFYRTEEGDYWRIYVLIEGGKSEERITPSSAYLAGKAFGEFQNQLSDLPEDTIIESIPNFHNLEFRMQQLHDAIREDRAGRVATTLDLQEALLSREEEMCLAERLHREGLLHKHVSHCDTKVNNMMFDAEGRPLCIVDLDTVMPQYVLSDFGDFMRTAANTGDEDDPNLDNIHVDLKIFTAYTRGYLESASFLTPLEKELLPYAARLFSYMQAVRFFTDYLNGDTYYQIQYPEHNLIRTRAQLRLLEEQERCRPAMEAIVRALDAKKPVLILPQGEEQYLTISHVNWPDSFPEKPQTKVRISFDENEGMQPSSATLSLVFDVQGNDLRAEYAEDFGEVWTDSCCEFFCRPVGSPSYQNYEINCIGAMTASARTARKENVHFRTADEMGSIQRFAPLGRAPFAEKTGPQSWSVGMRIPLSLIFSDAPVSSDGPIFPDGNVSPDENEGKWQCSSERGIAQDRKQTPLLLEANFYKCADLAPHPHYLSWSPIPTPKPDFHRPECFGLLVLTDR